ncbi:MAG: hypothetical protein PHT76_13115 [Anaerostipes sp.]|nr:hypothetical protein [Anaerostipes sp.]
MTTITYNNYLAEPDPLFFEEAMEIYEKILQNLENETDALKDAWKTALKAMTTYADLRANWLQQTKEEHHEAGRTAKHDAVIHSLDALCETMESLNMDAAWRNQLGTARKRIGDFACYVSCIYGICAR